MTTPMNPTTPNPEQNIHDANPPTQPFPPPQTFTILPQLYTLISHLAPLQPQSTSTNPNPTTTSPSNSRASRSPTLTRRPADSQTQTQTQASDPTSSLGVGPTLSLTHTRSRDDIIDLKDLPGLVYPLRQQLERAKEVVASMPDVGRSVEEQEAEILDLQRRIVGLKGRLLELRGRVEGGDGDESRSGSRDADVVMLGVES